MRLTLRATVAATVAAGILTIGAGSAFAASRPVTTAGAIRTAGGKAIIKVDGKTHQRGTVAVGRNFEARVYIPRNVKVAKPISVVVYQTSSFNLASSRQRFAQAFRMRVVSGKWNSLRLRVPACGKWQVDVIVGTPIGADRPGQWGPYPRYTGRQLLTAAFVDPGSYR